MPSSWLLGGLIGRIRKMKSNDEDDDLTNNLALVKAAAWAWYQHGSGSSEGNLPVAEFDLAAAGLVKRPAAARPSSRYMTEAMGSTAKGTTSTPHDLCCDHSLLDSHEIHSISKELGNLIRANGSGSSYSASTGLLDPQETATGSKEKKDVSSSRDLITRRLRRPVVTCGAVMKDVEISALVRRPRKRR